MIKHSIARFWTARRIFAVLAAIVFLILIGFNLDIITRAFRQLQNTNLAIFALVPSFVALSYFFIANYYVSFFKAFKKTPRLSRMYRLVLALNFVNQILPSGGLSGTTYFIYGIDKTRHKVPVGLATLSHLGRYIFAYISYFFVLIAAFIFLRISDDPVTEEFLHEGFRVFGLNFTGNSLIVSLFLVSVILITGIWYIISSKRRVDAFIGSIGRLIDGVVKRFRKGRPVFGKAAIESTIRDFHDGYVWLRRSSQNLLLPLSFMVLSTVCEVLVVYFAYAAVGASINPGVIMLAFTIANVAGVVSVIPGDVGVHETVMVVMLTLAGVDGGTALSGALLYRVLTKFMFTGIGFYFYNRILKPVTSEQ